MSSFSLGGRPNLSEITLEVERDNSCLVTTSADILSTIDPTQHARLERIKLMTECVHQWICEKSRDRLAQAWRHLDITLSELARVTLSAKGEKLVVFLTSTHEEKCITLGRNWGPELLPCFHAVGEPHVEFERGRPKVDSDRGCVCCHESTSPQEEYDDASQIVQPIHPRSWDDRVYLHHSCSYRASD